MITDLNPYNELTLMTYHHMNAIIVYIRVNQYNSRYPRSIKNFQIQTNFLKYRL